VVRDSRLATNFRPDAPSLTGRNPPPTPDPFVKTAGGEQLASPAPRPATKIAKTVLRIRVDPESAHQSRDHERERGRMALLDRRVCGQGAIDRGFDVQPRRGEHRDGAVLGADQELDLGAAEDHALGARAEKAADDLPVGVS
jgi:hypothetical protein